MLYKIYSGRKWVILKYIICSYGITFCLMHYQFHNTKIIQCQAKSKYILNRAHSKYCLSSILNIYRRYNKHIQIYSLLNIFKIYPLTSIFNICLLSSTFKVYPPASKFKTYPLTGIFKIYPLTSIFKPYLTSRIFKIHSLLSV